MTESFDISEVGAELEDELVDAEFDESHRQALNAALAKRLSRNERLDNRRYHTAGAIEDIKVNTDIPMFDFNFLANVYQCKKKNVLSSRRNRMPKTTAYTNAFRGTTDNKRIKQCRPIRACQLVGCSAQD